MLSNNLRFFACLLAICTFVATSAAAQTGTVSCQSDGGYRYYRVDTQNQVHLVRRLSGVECRQDYNWGFDYRGIWVDRGCRAQFQYGLPQASSTGTAIAAGVLGAIIVGAIVAGSNDDHSHSASQRDYYRDGYRMGQRDWDFGKPPYYLGYRNRFPRKFEAAFARGYDDGYNNRHGTRDRFDDDVHTNIYNSFDFPEPSPPPQPRKGPRPGSPNYGTINNPNHGAGAPQPGDVDYGTINNPNHGAGDPEPGDEDSYPQ